MAGKKLFVGNLKYSVTSEDLEELFSPFGEVVEAKVIEGRGFGFIEMSDETEAEKAKEDLNGTDYSGRTLNIDEAHPPRSRDRGGRGGGGGGGGGGYQRY